MLEMSVVMSLRSCDGKVFHTRGMAAGKLLSPRWPETVILAKERAHLSLWCPVFFSLFIIVVSLLIVLFDGHAVVRSVWWAIICRCYCTACA